MGKVGESLSRLKRQVDDLNTKVSKLEERLIQLEDRYKSETKAGGTIFGKRSK